MVSKGSKINFNAERGFRSSVAKDCSSEDACLGLELPGCTLRKGPQRKLWAGQHRKLCPPSQASCGACEDHSPAACLKLSRHYLQQDP